MRDFFEDFNNFDDEIEEIAKLVEEIECDEDYHVYCEEITSEDILTYQGYYFDYWGGNN